MIKQILINLLSNAVKFTPAGGSAEIACELDQDGGISLNVTDTGIGIAKKDIRKVTVPFGQVESTLNRKHEGTGLGLAIVSSYAELHDAKLVIASAPGDGTTVKVVFPKSRSVPEQKRSTQASAPVPGSGAAPQATG